MQKLNILLSTLAISLPLALTACGGSGGNTPHFDALVSFGDSISDAGSYKTPGVAALGGGKHTVNGPGDTVWIEHIASDLSLPAPCAAQTGLLATGDFAALAGTPTNHPSCAAYGQSGSRVTDPMGPWNVAALASPDPAVAYTGQLGQLTVPVASQVATHLSGLGGRFSGRELVLVLAGSNDVFMNLSAVGTELSPEQTVVAMAKAGAELATLVKAELVGKGAKHVLVLNLPNISLTPGIAAAESTAPGSKALTEAMTQAFNAQLGAGLAGVPGVLQADFYTAMTQYVQNPAAWGLTNVSMPACNNRFPGQQEFLGSSLLCTTSTTLPGDVSHYLFADAIHPTPYGHLLVANLARSTMRQAGWMD